MNQTGSRILYGKGSVGLQKVIKVILTVLEYDYLDLKKKCPNPN
jgi:hypothetical protein